jgi:DNA-binding LytR/AlgR family response regulator
VQFSYLIIDTTSAGEKLKTKIDEFENYFCLGICTSPDEAVNKILELDPNLVFLSVDEGAAAFGIVSELNEYMAELPTIIAISNSTEPAYEAFQRGLSGILLRPIEMTMLRKCLYRYQKNHRPSIEKKICIKSQGDYHFIKAHEIVYLKADNNTTDFYLENGKMISAYKTLKYYENLLPSYFFRIHHSYIINIEFVSRINIGKADCYLSENKIVLPFSRTYKSNIDTIIGRIA